MTLFSYKAKTMAGQRVTGEVQASSIEQAAELLRAKKYVIISLNPLRGSPFAFLSRLLRRATSDDVVMFTRQLSTMTAAGLPLTDALRILRTQSGPAMSDVVSSILEDVEGGSSLADALSKHPKVFSDVYVALVRAGESAGVLENILNRLAGTLEKNKEFSGKVKGALVYPAMVIVAMVVVGLLMMILVVPKLTAMYKNFNTELPLPTKVLMSVSAAIATYWYIAIGGIVLAVFLFRQWLKTPGGRARFETIIFKTPIIGRLSKFVILTEFTRTLGLLVSAGISIIDGLKITAAAVGNSLYRDALLSAAVQVEKGLPLAVPIAQNPNFPPILSQMISVGEETGKVDEVLTKLSAYFERESEQGVGTLTAAVEPLIMILLGVGVGFLVIAIILPIYNLTSAF